MGIGYGVGGGSQFFGVFMALFVLVFIVIIAVIVFSVSRGIVRWNKNNHSPRLTVNARVVSKRMEVSHHHHHGSGHGTNLYSSTWYYVTFQFDSGDRIELAVDGFQYGMLAEGDCGKLTFQGTRYLDFSRS